MQFFADFWLEIEPKLSFHCFYNALIAGKSRGNRPLITRFLMFKSMKKDVGGIYTLCACYDKVFYGHARTRHACVVRWQSLIRTDRRYIGVYALYPRYEGPPEDLFRTFE